MDQASPLQIPDVELIDELGRGRFSVVYRAQRGDRSVAVKVPLQTGNDAENQRAARHFLREAIALARIRHPMLPEVKEVGVRPSPYLILELVSGETLSTRLSRGLLTEAMTVALGRQLADALEHIHRAGLVHRDVSPRNILLDTQTGSVRLVDFGFALPQSAFGANRYLGTPTYAAPEQQRELGERVDGRADLYSLGRVLAECLGLGRDKPAVVSQGLQAIIAQLCETDPDERFQTGAEVITALINLDSEAVPAPSPAVRRRARKRATDEFWKPLRGRSTERSALETAWMDAQTLGGRLVSVVGPAGSGKTHLIHDFLQELEAAHINALRVNCREGAQEPFALVRQLIDAKLGQLEALSPVERARARKTLWEQTRQLAIYLRALSSRYARLFPEEGPRDTGEDSDPALAERFANLIQVVLDQPTIVFVDDLQWLDDTSRRVLQRLTQRCHETRSLFILASRTPEAVEDFRHIARDVQLLLLEPLVKAASLAVVTDFLGGTRIEADDAAFLVGFSDGTPLSVVEVLRSVLESGALVPHWGVWRLDREHLSQLRLTRSTEDVLSRRLDTLDESTLSVLVAAAVLGRRFEDTLLGEICGLQPNQINAELSQARSAQLVASLPKGSHRFVHDSIREALAARLSDQQKRGLHGRIAAALDRRLPGREDRFGSVLRASESTALNDSDLDLEALFTLAIHYIQAQSDDQAERAYEVCSLAGRLAFRVYDNARAIRFLAASDELAKRLAHKPSPASVYAHAEAHRRIGELEQADALYQNVITLETSSIRRARAWTRIAWLRMQLEQDDAQPAIEAACKELGVAAPGQTAAGLLGDVARWATRSTPLGSLQTKHPREYYETLADTYYQAGRIASNSTDVRTQVHATIACLTAAEHVGPSTVLVNAQLLYGMMMIATGQKERGRAYRASAEAMAAALNDPATTAQYHLGSTAVHGFAGEIEQAVKACRHVMAESAPWLTASDYSVVAHLHAQLEGMRGHSSSEWLWLQRAIEHVTLLRGTPMVLEFLEEAARAALAALGREAEADAVLAPLHQITVSASGRGFMNQLNFGSRLRVFTERGDLGRQLEELVAEFEKEKLNPKRVHPIVVEYYVHLAHARVHACLRATPSSIDQERARLQKAHTDLAAAARIPLFEAHAVVVKAFIELFAGKFDAALAEFSRAEALGTNENAALVLYQVHRGRAHLYQQRGASEAARDQAKLAETLAREHAAAYRVRWIREEFGLERVRRRESGIRLSEFPPASVGSPRSTAGQSPALRGRGYLRALLRISQAHVRELDLDHQARLVVDELIHALQAERGTLLLTDRKTASSEPPTLTDLKVLCTRNREGRSLADEDAFDTGIVAEVLAFEANAREELQSGRSLIAADLTHSKIAVPLMIGPDLVGAVYMDRPLREGPFTEHDGEALWALAAQVPVALELARELGSRERRAEQLRTLQKMRAIERLAAGVAHDFNNMLAVVVGSVESMLRSADLPEHLIEDARAIRGATDRARDLTGQLLNFASGHFKKPSTVHLNERIEKLAPTLRRVMGDGITLDMDLAVDLWTVEADPTQMDQVVTNLAINARDAMPSGGRLTIRTENVRLEQSDVERAPELAAGPQVRLSIRDSGVGMDEHVRSRIFEPFFTTKPKERGTGLGLATVYSIVTHSGGRISVKSAPGVGTTFVVHLPRSPTIIDTAEVEEPRSGHRIRTVMVVDDELVVRRSLGRLLGRLGYEAIQAESATKALALLEEQAVDVVLTDVVMPEMNGLELAQELEKRAQKPRIVFMSGYSDGILTRQGDVEQRLRYLQKPISAEGLKRCLRELAEETLDEPTGT